MKAETETETDNLVPLDHFIGSHLPHAMTNQLIGWKVTLMKLENSHEARRVKDCRTSEARMDFA